MIYSIWCILSLFITNTDYCIWLNRSNMIVHNLGRKRKGTFYSISGFWLSHHGWNVTSSEKYKNHGSFLHKNATRVLASKMSQKHDQSGWYVVQQRRYCRPRKITKDYLFFLFFLKHSNHRYVNSNFTKTHWLSLKIDKRDKLLKVDVLSDAERLFGVTPKRDMQRKIMSYFIRNQTTKQSKKWNSSPV